MIHSDLKKMTLSEVRAAGFTTAVLPIGATEPHNYHLPYGTDSYQVEHVAREATRRANEKGGHCVCLPIIPFGYDGNMEGFPLAISLQPTTIICVIRDIALSLVESGLDHLFILNGHGGNELKTIIRELYQEIDLFISGANWWESVKDVSARVCPGNGDHAHAEETAACLHIVPELVRMDQADGGHMNKPVIEELTQGWVKFSRPWMAFAPSSGAGDPRTATAEGGRELLEAANQRIGDYLYKLSTAKRYKGFPYAPLGE